MADEKTILDEAKKSDEGNAETPKLYTEDELQKIVQKRLKKHIGQNETLQQQLQALQQTNAVPPENPESAESTPAPQQANGASPLTADAMRSIMEDVNKQSVNAQNTQRALAFHNENIQKMRDADPEFDKLANSDNPLGVPSDVAIHLSNALNHDQAKKIFKELLTNETANLKMQNAALSGTYEDWLQKILNNSMPSEEEGKATRTAPELSQEQTGASPEQGDEVLLDYIKNA